MRYKQLKGNDSTPDDRSRDEIHENTRLPLDDFEYGNAPLYVNSILSILMIDSAIGVGASAFRANSEKHAVIQNSPCMRKF